MGLNIKQANLFGKYWGKRDLEQDDEFWLDAYLSYKFHTVELPIRYNPQSVRRVLEMLNCPPGKCGDCCRYNYVPVWETDIDRIVAKTKYSRKQVDKFLSFHGEQGFINGISSGQCPFLKDKVCTIHDVRPDVCWLYPISPFPREMTIQGKKTLQMRMHIFCPESMRVIRTIITEAISGGELMLLPDLSLIPRWNNVGSAKQGKDYSKQLWRTEEE